MHTRLMPALFALRYIKSFWVLILTSSCTVPVVQEIVSNPHAELPEVSRVYIILEARAPSDRDKFQKIFHDELEKFFSKKAIETKFYLPTGLEVDRFSYLEEQKTYNPDVVLYVKAGEHSADGYCNCLYHVDVLSMPSGNLLWRMVVASGLTLSPTQDIKDVLTKIVLQFKKDAVFKLKQFI